MDRKKLQSLFFLLILIVFGSFLRIYNINYDDMWSDEMISFWTSDPTIPLTETFKRIFSSQLMVSYEILLKFYHYLFGYDVYTSKYFSSLISVISLLLFYNLIKKNSSNNSAIFGLFLLVINIYHIKYSLELRSYILCFLLVIILIDQIFNNKKIKKDFYISNYFIVFLITFVLLFSHALSIIVIISLVLFLLIKLTISPSNNKSERNLISVLLLSCSLFLFVYLNNISHYPEWVEQVKASFYTNFYFSKFFGSRILGLLYLITLLYLVIKFKEKFIKEFNILTLLLIIIFNSYFLPLLFGYLIKPILVDRYIFFVIIPVIFLISHLIFLIKNKMLKYFFVIALSLITLSNHFFQEYAFKQIYTNIYPTKPEIKKTLNMIKSSNIKKYTIKMNVENSENINDVRLNYLKKYDDKFNFQTQLFNYFDKDKYPEIFWIIYFTDITNEKFKIPNNFENYQISKIEKFNRIELYLLKKP